MAAIVTYAQKLEENYTVVLKDVSRYSTAVQIYDALKKEKLIGNLKGIQIFGSSAEVPAFDVHFKIQMEKGIDDGGQFKTDFFYSTFDNDSNILKNDFSIFESFDKKLNVSYKSDWIVSRLPLTRGEIAPFIQKYDDYITQADKMDIVPLVNFSNPIFASPNHSDDMGYFIKERLDREFGVISSNHYKLYGNLDGYFPVKTPVLGGFTQENIRKENGMGICDFFINSHGQFNNIDQAIYETSEPESEKRISFLNNGNINSILNQNYYTLNMWTCNNAWALDANNLMHEALAKGKCVNAMAASSVLSNNGVNNNASIEELKKNNLYYFQLEFFRNLGFDNTRSQSFQLAQKAYAEEIMENTDLSLNGNYQFNLHNVLTYHFLGLIEYNDPKHHGLITVNDIDEITNTNNEDSSDYYNKDTPSIDANGNIEYKASANLSSLGITIIGFKANRVGNNVVFSLEYVSSKDIRYSFFNPPNGDIIKIFTQAYVIKPGKGSLSISVPVEKLKLVSDISILFINSQNERGSIYFLTDQISNLN